MTAKQLRTRLTKICLGLPEATERSAGRHSAYLVRTKKFAYFLDDHGGDGRRAVTTRAAPGQNSVLVEADPRRYFIPAYTGRRGWVGHYLHVGRVDWDEVDELVLESYLLAAPKKLAALVEGEPG